MSCSYFVEGETEAGEGRGLPGLLLVGPISGTVSPQWSHSPQACELLSVGHLVPQLLEPWPRGSSSSGFEGSRMEPPALISEASERGPWRSCGNEHGVFGFAFLPLRGAGRVRSWVPSEVNGGDLVC